MKETLVIRTTKVLNLNVRRVLGNVLIKKIELGGKTTAVNSDVQVIE